MSIFNAYDLVEAWKDLQDLDEARFNEAIRKFRAQYLVELQYPAKVLQHRRPLEARAEILQQLYNAHRDIQHRPEMRDGTYTPQALKFVPSIIAEIWLSDINRTSLFSAIDIYAATVGRDRKTVAAHLAEYRAVVKLIDKIQRDIDRSAKEGEPSQKDHKVSYTFEDWLSNKCYSEKTYLGEYVANDTEKYLDLVSMGKMAFEDLNKVQEAQQKTYEYMIEYSLKLNEQHLQRQTKQTLDWQKVIEIKIAETQEYIKKYEDVYKEVILPRLHRGIKIGAKFILPEEYTDCLAGKIVDAHTRHAAPYMLNIDGVLTSFPTTEQRRYAVMEVAVRWLKRLTSYKAKIKYQEMIGSPDFKTLMERYGGEAELMDQYTEGLSFAPDRDRFLRNRIDAFESVIPRYQSSMAVWDPNIRQQIHIETGEYRRIGFAWVNNGHNAASREFVSMTMNNLTLCPNVAEEDRYGVYTVVLHELAKGGVIAFHIAFLKKQLARDGTGDSPTRGMPQAFWQGTDGERQSLFDALAQEQFIDDTADNRHAFLNNRQVIWNAPTRSLFYLLEELKKPYRKLLMMQDLGPLIRNNFLAAGGKAVKNISQNKSGMYNANKSGRPRNADVIDRLLAKTFGDSKNR